MKNLLFSLIVLLASCAGVVFDKPQPEDGTKLYEFPQNLLGTYVNEEFDTLIIEKKTFSYNSNIDNFLKSDSSMIRKGKSTLNEELNENKFIIEYNSEYYYNFWNDHGWYIIYARPEKDGLWLSTIDPDDEQEKTIFSNFDATPDSSGIIIHADNSEFLKFVEMGFFNQKSFFKKMK